MAKYNIRQRQIEEVRFEKAISALIGNENIDANQKVQFFDLINQIADQGDQDIKDFWDSIIGQTPIISDLGDVTIGEFVKTDLFPGDIFIKIADPDEVGNQSPTECLVVRIRNLILVKAPKSLQVTLLPDVIVDISNVS